MKISLFWSITNPQNGSISFILGTMHRCSPEVYAKLDFVDKYYKMVSDVVFEYNMSEEIHSLAEISLFPDKSNLKDHMTAKRYHKLKSKIQKYFDINLDSVSHMRPLFLNTLLQEKFLGDNLISMDESLYKKALNSGLRISGLESLEKNLELFKKLDLDNEIDQLMNFIKNINKSKTKLKSMEKAYIKEDIQKLYKMSKRGIGNLKSILLYDRNKIFVEELMAMGDGRSYLACIGAGHLSGKFGVLRALKSRGLIVKPIYIKDR